MENTAQLKFDNSYFRELEGFYAVCTPEAAPEPGWVRFNYSLAEELGLNGEDFVTSSGAKIFSGTVLPSGASPIAQVYAGHQFGNFVPQLGDGRALLLGEVIDPRGQRRDIQLKGSGRTPFSRNGDGKAAIGPMLREYLIGEAMHHLGISTTRALAVVATGEFVRREALLPGAVLTRVSASHIRIGTFEYFAARGDFENVRRLSDYTVKRHFPELIGQPYIKFLLEVIKLQAQLVASWMSVGFIHGVMNTDNMAISGETIDYGPCAFLEHYDPAAVFSSIDRRGRYAFGNQPMVAQWNLARLSETLLPLLDKDNIRAVRLATDAINTFPEQYEKVWLKLMGQKMGLKRLEKGDERLIQEFLDILHAGQVDYTLGWRNLANAAEFNPVKLRNLFRGVDTKELDEWLPRWQARLTREGLPPAEIAAEMRLVSPYLIPRNHLVEQALNSASDSGDLLPFDRLLEALGDPYTESESALQYAQPATFEQTAAYQTFCGT